MRTVCIYQQLFVLHVSCWGFCSAATWANSHSYLSLRSSTRFLCFLSGGLGSFLVGAPYRGLCWALEGQHRPSKRTVVWTLEHQIFRNYLCPVAQCHWRYMLYAFARCLTCMNKFHIFIHFNEASEVRWRIWFVVIITLSDFSKQCKPG